MTESQKFDPTFGVNPKTRQEHTYDDLNRAYQIGGDQATATVWPNANVVADNTRHYQSEVAHANTFKSALELANRATGLNNRNEVIERTENVDLSQKIATEMTARATELEKQKVDQLNAIINQPKTTLEEVHKWVAHSLGEGHISLEQYNALIQRGTEVKQKQEMDRLNIFIDTPQVMLQSILDFAADSLYMGRLSPEQYTALVLKAKAVKPEQALLLKAQNVGPLASKS